MPIYHIRRSIKEESNNTYFFKRNEHVYLSTIPQNRVAKHICRAHNCPYQSSWDNISIIYEQKKVIFFSCLSQKKFKVFFITENQVVKSVMVILI